MPATEPGGTEPAQELHGGDRLRATFATGQVHRYEVDLRAGDVVSVEVEQRGVDVRLRWLSPDGDLLLEADSPSGDEGAEELWCQAGDSGRFRLQVVRLAALKSPAAGEYQLELKVAAPNHRALERVAASLDLGRALQALGRNPPDPRGATLALGLAAAKLHRLDLPRQEGLARYRLGTSAEPALRRDHLEAALACFVQAGDPRMQLFTLQRLGTVLRLSGDLDAAEARQRAALALAGTLGDTCGEAVSWHNLAVLYQQRAELDRALDFYDLALDGFRRCRRPGDAASTLRNLGYLYNLLGQLPEAADALQEGLRLHQDLDDPAGRAALSMELGWTFYRQGRLEMARDLLERSLAVRRELADRGGEAGTLDRLGTVYGALGEDARAAAAYARALALSRAAKRPLDAAVTQANLAEVLLRQGHLQRADELLAAALATFREQSAEDLQAHALYLQARLRLAQDRLPAARELLEQTATLTSALREQLGPSTAGMYFFGTRHSYLDLQLAVLLRLHAQDPAGDFARRAFEALERSRARGLLAGLDASAGRRPPELAPLENRVRRLEEERQRARGSGDTERLADLERELRGALDRLSRRQAEAVARPEPPEPPSLPAVQAQLGPEDLLLSYHLGDEGSVLFAVSAAGLDVATLPPPRTLEPLALAAHNLLRQEGGAESQVQRDLLLRRLGQDLLGPVADRLPEVRRLVVIPEGALNLVPISVLASPLDGQPVVASHEVVQLPSTGWLLRRRQQSSTAPRPRAVAVWADPVVTSSDPRLAGAPSSPAGPEDGPADLLRSARDLDLEGFARLPASGREARLLADLAGRGATWTALGFAASRGSVLSLPLRRFSVLHFATHGLLHPLRPELSGLVLSLYDAQGQPRDGFLRAYEIAGLDLDADLVVLSACTTAVGPAVPGEGLLGLPRSFLLAGAHRVVASLWSVDDRATAELMDHFYRGYWQQRLPAGEALRQAQLALRRSAEWSEPRYWAGFELQGDWH